MGPTVNTEECLPTRVIKIGAETLEETLSTISTLVSRYPTAYVHVQITPRIETGMTFGAKEDVFFGYYTVLTITYDDSEE